MGGDGRQVRRRRQLGALVDAHGERSAVGLRPRGDEGRGRQRHGGGHGQGSPPPLVPDARRGRAGLVGLVGLQDRQDHLERGVREGAIVGEADGAAGPGPGLLGSTPVGFVVPHVRHHGPAGRRLAVVVPHGACHQGRSTGRRVRPVSRCSTLVG
jgi:hypothetical protein